jgi:hypothetical protein
MDANGLSLQRSVVVQVTPLVPLPGHPGVLPPAPPAVTPSAPTISVATPAPADTAPTQPTPAAVTASRGGGASVPALEITAARPAQADDAAEGTRTLRTAAPAIKLRDGGDGMPFTLSFALFSPDELQAQTVAADESPLQRSVDALLKQSFGFTRGPAQPDETPADPRETSTTETFLQVMTDPVKVSSVAFTAGFVWWLTRSGGLLATMLMGIPAWRHIDLAPVLARPLDEEDDEHEFDLLAAETESGLPDALSEVRLRSLMNDPSLQSVPGEWDGAAADLFQPQDTTAPAGQRR